MAITKAFIVECDNCGKKETIVVKNQEELRRHPSMRMWVLGSTTGYIKVHCPDCRYKR